jgi:hypothetical protein
LLLVKATSYLAVLAVSPEIFGWTEATVAADFLLQSLYVFCYGLEEFASVFEGAVDVAGAAVDSASTEQSRNCFRVFLFHPCPVSSDV